MTNKQLQLYLRRISSQLSNIGELIEKELPSDIARVEIKKKRLKPEVQKTIDDKKNPLIPSGFYTKGFDDDSWEHYIEHGDIIALIPLYQFINELNDDIYILEEKESE